MRCCPFAEGNANAHQSMLASMASVHKPLYASMMTASQPTYSVYATPPRQVPMRVAPPLFPAGPSPTTTASTHMLQGQVPYFPLSVGPQTFPTLPALQSPFGPLMSTSGAQTSYREIPTSQATQDVSPSGQADKGRSDSTNLLYDSGYGRYPGDQEKHGFVQDAKIVDVNRPITPSPTGSQSSGCSFAFSSTSAPDVESPTTSIESNGSTSSVSSPDTSSKVIRTPPSSKFRQFEDSQKMLAMSNAVEQDCTDAIEQGLHSFERRNNGLKSSTDNLTSNPQSDQKR